MKPIPEVGKEYNCFDDGKINKSRLYTVIVKEIIKVKNVDPDILEMWEEEVEQCDWLYAEETDYFIKTDNGDENPEYFVRTVEGEWFSIGGFLNSGLLDVDGEMYNTFING